MYPPLAAPVFAVPTIGAGQLCAELPSSLQALMAATQPSSSSSSPSALSGATVLPPLPRTASAVAVSACLVGPNRVHTLRLLACSADDRGPCLGGRKPPRLGTGVLAFGTLAKIYPAVLLPLLLVRADRERRGGWRPALVVIRHGHVRSPRAACRHRGRRPSIHTPPTSCRATLHRHPRGSIIFSAGASYTSRTSSSHTARTTSSVGCSTASVPPSARSSGLVALGLVSVCIRAQVSLVAGAADRRQQRRSPSM